MDLKAKCFALSIMMGVGAVSTSAHAACPGGFDWITVTAAGTKAYGNMPSVTKVAGYSGQYIVTGNGFIRDGAFVGSIGSTNGTLNVVGIFTATKETSSGTNAKVYVMTFDHAGAAKDLPFHLHVMC